MEKGTGEGQPWKVRAGSPAQDPALMTKKVTVALRALKRVLSRLSLMPKV